MENKENLDEVLIGTHKGIWKNASEEQKQNLINQYTQQRQKGDLAYARKVSDKLNSIRVYERRIKEGSVEGSEKVNYRTRKGKVLEYVPGKYHSGISNYEPSNKLNNYLWKKKTKLNSVLENWMKNTFRNYKESVESIKDEIVKEKVNPEIANEKKDKREESRAYKTGYNVGKKIVQAKESVRKGLEKYFVSDKKNDKTAVITMYNPNTEKTIDLVGVCHMGSPSYYKNIENILGNDDAVLYEMPGGPFKRSREKRKGIYNRLVRKISKSVSEFYHDKIKEKLSFSKKKKTSQEEIKNLEERFENNLKVVPQLEAIDYSRLPSKWVHADLEKSHFPRKTFSIKKGIQYLKMSLVNFLLNFKFFRRIVAKKIEKQGIISKADDGNFGAHKFRENIVYNKFDKLNNKKDVNRVGVFYGARHLARMEEEFKKRGFETKNIKYLNVRDKYVESIAA